METVKSIIKQQGIMRLPGVLRRYYFAHFVESPWREFADRYRCVFVHIPRTGGTSVTSAVFGQGFGHPLLEQFYAHDARRAAQYFKFAFVRNPWDRVVSAFHLLKHNDVPPPNNQWAATWLADTPDIGVFFDKLRNPFYRIVVLSWTHFLPQYLFVTYDGRVALDYCGRFEHLDEQFEIIAKRLGVELPLAHVNSSPRSDYRDYFTPASRKLIGEIYERDITEFGYRF